MSRPACVVLAFVWAMSACGASESAPSDVASAPPDAGGSTNPAPRSDPPCDPTELVVHKDVRGFVDRLYANITAENEEGAFLVDTGSQKSFAVLDAPGPTATSALISCRSTTLPVTYRGFERTTPDGAPERGVLGSDLLTYDAVFDLDLRRGTLGWYGAPAAVPGGTTVIPIEWRNGWLVASGIQVDGKPMKLVVDTGSPHVFLMGKTPRPGEQRQDSTDGSGAPVTYWVADGDVTLPGRPAVRVPIDRAESFETLESVIADLGGDVVGLLGLAPLGDRRIIITKTALIVDLAP